MSGSAPAETSRSHAGSKPASKPNHKPAAAKPRGRALGAPAPKGAPPLTADDGPQLHVELSLPAALALALRRAQFVSLLELTDHLARSGRRHHFRSCRRPAQRPSEAPAAIGQPG